MLNTLNLVFLDAVDSIVQRPILLRVQNAVQAIAEKCDFDISENKALLQHVCMSEI